MSDTEQFKKLYGDSKTLNFEQGDFEMEVEVEPINTEALFKGIAFSDKPGADDSQVAKVLISNTLEKAGYEVPVNEVGELPARVTMGLLQAIEEVNGLEDFFDEDANEIASKMQQ